MGEVYDGYGDDPDVAALYADSLMNLTPWALWDLSTGAPAEGARTVEAKEVLESALARTRAMAHPGLLHFYIHLMEMSPSPEHALDAANALRKLVPDGGHLVHMPTHISSASDFAIEIAVGNSPSLGGSRLSGPRIWRS